MISGSLNERIAVIKASKERGGTAHGKDKSEESVEVVESEGLDGETGRSKSKGTKDAME